MTVHLPGGVSHQATFWPGDTWTAFSYSVGDTEEITQLTIEFSGLPAGDYDHVELSCVAPLIPGAGQVQQVEIVSVLPEAYSGADLALVGSLYYRLIGRG